jgi:pyridoxal phosphate enzyme (YggS family)
MLHSLDRMSLAKELNKRLEKEKLKLKVLIQINIGKEPQKGGVMPEDTEKFISELSELTALDVSGLMCMPSVLNTRDETVKDFAATKKIFDDLLSAGFNMRYLSMGMSDDFEEAIKQGANIVRIGSAIFGQRA